MRNRLPSFGRACRSRWYIEPGANLTGLGSLGLRIFWGFAMQIVDFSKGKRVASVEFSFRASGVKVSGLRLQALTFCNSGLGLTARLVNARFHLHIWRVSQPRK